MQQSAYPSATGAGGSRPLRDQPVANGRQCSSTWGQAVLEAIADAREIFAAPVGSPEGRLARRA